MAITFSVFSLTALSLKIRVEPNPVRRSFTVILRKDIFLATLLRLGELWATWGTTTWIFSMLILYRGAPPGLSTVFLGLFGLGQLLGILSVERVVERLGDISVIMINLVGFIIISLLIVVSPLTLVLVEALFLGVCSFAYRPPTDSLIMKIAGVGSAATSIGYANAVSQIGTMIAPVLVGVILSITRSFAISMFGIDTGCVVGIIALMILRGGLKNGDS